MGLNCFVKFLAGEAYDDHEETRKGWKIAKYLEKNRESLHHIAFDVEDIEKEMARLQNEGIRTLNDRPKKRSRK